MRRSMLLGVVLAAATALADDELDASDLKHRGHMLYGNTSLRILGHGAYQSGTNPIAPGAGQFSRATFGVAFEGGYLGLFTSLGTLQGIEFKLAAGYSLAETYVTTPPVEPHGGLLLRAEANWHFIPRFLRFNDWRVGAITGIGLELDGARWTDTWRAFANLGARLQLFFSREASLSVSWVWMPGTMNQRLTLRTHAVELLLAIEAVHVGFRGQLDLAGTVEGPGLAWQGGLVAGYAF